MGSLFSHLTNLGVTQGGKTEYPGNDFSAIQSYARKQAPEIQTNQAILPNSIAPEPHWAAPAILRPGGGSQPQMLDSGPPEGPAAPSPQPPTLFKRTGGENEPTMRRPSYGEASQSGQINAAESKGGKLLTLLKAGLAGALAGAGSKTVGEGFQRATFMPMQRAQAKQELEQGQLQNEALKAQAQYAPMLTALGIRKTQADIGQSEAATAKAKREASQPLLVPHETAIVGNKLMQWNPSTQRFDIEIGPAKGDTSKSETELAIDAVNPDPKISGPAKAALEGMDTRRTAHDKAVAGYAADRQAATFAQRDKLAKDREDRRSQIAPKDVTTIKTKLNNIALAKAQLEQVRAKSRALDGTLGSGILGGHIATEAGKQFDGAIDAMKQTITGITRVPGVGSMSNYDAMLNQAQLPERAAYASVRAQKIDQLSAMLDALDTGYNDMLSGNDLVAPAPSTKKPAGSKKQPSGVPVYDVNGNLVSK